MIQNAQKNPDLRRNLSTFSLSRAQRFQHKTFYQNPFIVFLYQSSCRKSAEQKTWP